MATLTNPESESEGSDSDSDIPSIHGESDSNPNPKPQSSPESPSESESDSDAYTQGDRLAAFLRRDNLEESTALPRKRPRKSPTEAPYEQHPRLAAKSTSDWNKKPIADPLPIKSPDGTLSRITKPKPSPPTLTEPPPTSIKTQPQNHHNENPKSGPDHGYIPQLTKTEQRRRKAAAERRAYALLSKEAVLARTRRLKGEMAVLGRKLVAHPESAVHGTTDDPSCLRQLLDLTKDMNGAVCKFALVSLLAAFKDVLPGYKIRLPTAEERRMRLKKEVRLLRRFERELLEGYHAYIQILQGILREEKPGTSTYALATKASCVLLAEKPHFNLREHLLALVVPLMSSPVEPVSTECTDCVRQLLKDDPNGEITLEVITQISRLVRRKGDTVKPDVIRATFHAKLTADLKDDQRAKQAKVVKKVRKRRRKRGDEVGLGLQEAAATEDPALKHARQAESLRELFVMYLRVLKRLPKSAMLPTVLEGIAKFLHLLNLDLVQALASVLSQRVRNHEFSIPSALQAIKTMLTLMQGAGRELRMEDTVYLAALLQLIAKLRSAEARDAAIPRLIECLEVAFLRKNQQRAKHVPVFICELASLVIRELTFRYEQATVYLFEPEIDEAGDILPATIQDQLLMGDRQGAVGLWALAQLQFHYHPTLRKSARSALAKQRLLPDERAMKVYSEYDASKGGFNPPVQSSPPKRGASDVEGSVFAEADYTDVVTPRFDLAFRNSFMARSS